MGLECYPPGCPKWRVGVQRCVARSWLLGTSWAPVCIYPVLAVVVTRLVDAVMFAHRNTHQIYTNKEERAAAVCSNRFLRCGDGFWLCVTEFWASITGLDCTLSWHCWGGVLARKPRSLLKVTGRTWNAKTCLYCFSIAWLTRIKVVRQEGYTAQQFGMKSSSNVFSKNRNRTEKPR